MHAFILSVVGWFKVGSLLGIPRTGWALLTFVILIDVIFQHVKNPKLNHIAGIVALLAQKIVVMLQISKIPLLGPSIIGILNVIIGVPPGGLPIPVSVPVPPRDMDTPPERPRDPGKAA